VINPGVKKYWFHHRWGLGTSVVHTEPEVPYNVTANGLGGYDLVDLGTVKIPDKPSKVSDFTIEFWSRQDTAGAVTFRADYLLLVPADEGLSVMRVPAGLSAATVTQQLRGDADRRSPTCEKTDQDGNHIFHLQKQGPDPIIMPVGMFALIMKFSDTGLAGHPRPQIINARRTIVSVRFAKRYYS
jgi:hypothetical protein